MQHRFNRFRNLHWKFTFSYTAITALLYLLLAFVVPYLVTLLLFFRWPNIELAMALERTISPKLVQHVTQDPPDIAQIQELLDPVCRNVKLHRLSQSYTYQPGPCTEEGYKELEFVRETTADAMRIVDGTQHLHFIAVLDQDGQVLTASPTALTQSDILANLTPEEQEQFAAMIAGESWWIDSAWYRWRTWSTLTVAGIHAPDEEVVAADDPHTYHGYIVVQAGPPPFEIYVEPATLMGATMVIFPFTFLISLLTSAVVTRRIVRRLRTIEEATVAWAQGDWSVQIDDDQRDEVGQLAHQLNRMAKQLHTQALAYHDEAQHKQEIST